MLFADAGEGALIWVFIIYVISVIIAFSPVGEEILCFFAGARKMKRVDMQNKITPLFSIVYQTAITQTPSLPKTIRLKIIYSSDANAYAIGRKTVCITEGLLRQPDDVIFGILAHEIAHLAHKHTFIQLLIGGGNFFVTLFILLLKVFAVIIGATSIVSGIRNRSFLQAAVGVFVAGAIWLWTKFCLLFLRWSMRESEYVADAYAVQIGYGYELAKALDATSRNNPQESFLKALYSTRPNVHDRIGRLQQLGVPYTSY